MGLRHQLNQLQRKGCPVQDFGVSWGIPFPGVMIPTGSYSSGGCLKYPESYTSYAFDSPGKRHGAGTLMFDGGIFEGQWARGEASGSGIATQLASD